MLSGKWLLCWVCLLLPFAKHDFKKTPIVLIYSFVVYAIVISIKYSYQYLYSDIAVYCLWTCLIGYYYTNKKSKARDIVLISGLLFLPQIKAYFGIILTIYILMIIIFDKLYYGKGKLNKSDKIFIGISGTSLAINLVIITILQKSMNLKEGDYTPFQYTESQNFVREKWCNMWDCFISTLKSPVGLLLGVMIACLLIVGVILFYKKYKKLAIFSILTAFLLGLVILLMIYLSLDDNSLLLLKKIPQHIVNLNYLNISMPNLIVGMVVIGFISYFFLLNKKDREYFFFLILILIAQCLAMYFIILLNFARKNSEEFILYGTALVRYLGVSVHFFIFLIPMIFLNKKDIWNKLDSKHRALIAGLALIFIIMNFFPLPLTIYKQKLDNFSVYSIAFSGIETNNITITEKTEEDDRVCVIYDIREYYKRPGYVDRILRYYTMISEDYYIKLDSEADSHQQINSLGNFILENEIDKVFYKWGGDDFDYAFKDLFLNPKDVIGDQVYDIVWVNNNLKLVRIKN